MTKLEVGTNVRFSEAWLAKLGEEHAKRYVGRIGVIDGYRLGALYPIVLFPKEGRRKELRLFEVDVRWLEVLPAVDCQN